MLIISTSSRSMRVYLLLWLGAVLTLMGLAGLGLQRYLLSSIEARSEAQMAALSRYQAQQMLVQSLLEGEVSLQVLLTQDTPEHWDAVNACSDAAKSALEAFESTIPLDDANIARADLDQIRNWLNGWSRWVAHGKLSTSHPTQLPQRKRESALRNPKFTEIQDVVERLGRKLNDQDNLRLDHFETRLHQARWIGYTAFAVVILVGFLVARKILRMVATPMVDLAEYAREGIGFPPPGLPHPVEEINVLQQALWELDTAAREREQGLRKRTEEALALQEYSQLVQQLRNEDELLASLEQALIRLLNPERCQIFLRVVEGEGLTGFRPLEPGSMTQHPILKDAMACRAIRQIAPVQLASTSPTACPCGLGVPARGSYLCIPPIAAGHAHGLVNLQAKRADHWTPERTRLAEACVSVAASALQTLRALAISRDHAVRDELTGVLNRRFLAEMLPKLLGQAKRQEQILSVAMVDIDHFKRINDTHGHDMGDKVLREIAHVLSAHLREGDLLIRYGGEEFVLILPQTSLELAYTLAERMRKLIETHTFPGDLRVTASFGVATMPSNASDGASLLSAGDQALYIAKGCGRNRVARIGDDAIQNNASRANGKDES